MVLAPSRETLARLDEVLAAPRGRRVGVLGLGVVGSAMALHLARRGADVVAADRKTDLSGHKRRAELAAAGIELRLGPMAAATFADVDALAISPGAAPAQPAARACVDRGIPLFGELELVGELPAQVIAITGTNGKSTTTSMIGALLEGLGKKVFVGGNLGLSIVEWLDGGAAVDVAVLELSSYQLETAYRFRPDVAVVLNVTPDHGERHPTLEEYALTKQQVLAGQKNSDVAVLSADDPRVIAMAGATDARLLWFSTGGAQLPGTGAVLDGEQMRPVGAVGLPAISLKHPRLFGVHNRENALASFLAVHGLCPLTDHSAAVAKAYHDFGGLEHRLEWVADQQQVRFINDSKATNDESAAVAVRALDRPIVLLLGGRDKGAGYERVAEAGKGRVRAIVAFGEAQPVIAAELGDRFELHTADNLAGAVQSARSLAQAGEAVLLAPACSSFDEFANFEQRGRVFKDLVAQGGRS